MRGRKKKANGDMVRKFLNNNSIYQVYDIVHPFNIVEYCEQNHIDEEEFYNLLLEMNVKVFETLEWKDINLSLYEQDFSKLKLKESAMTESGGASLSRILGRNKAWTDLRRCVLSEKDYTCEICGYRANVDNSKSLHVHEEWEQEENIVTLKKVSLVCSRCHACKHVNQFVIYRVLDGQDELVEGIPRIDLLTIHLMHVNKVSKEVIYAYRKKIHMYWREYEENKKDRILEQKEEGMQYKYKIGLTIPNRETLIKALQRKGVYQE